MLLGISDWEESGLVGNLDYICLSVMIYSVPGARKVEQEWGCGRGEPR